MAEKMIPDVDKETIPKDGHRRFVERVDVSKTPEQELEDARRRPAGQGTRDAITK